MEFTLLWAALTAFGLLWIGTRIWPDGLPDRPLDRLLGAAAVGLLSGRIAALIIQGTNPLANPGDVLIVRGGVDTATATVAAVGAYLWSVRGRLNFLDAAAPSALLGLAGWHGGCLWRSTCLGTASRLPWAWAEPDSLITRHPVEIYSALALVIAAWGVSRLSNSPLLRAGLALGAAGGARLVTQPLRLSLGGGPVAWYVAAILVGALAAIVGGRPVKSQDSPVT
jgi:prolipoprotein diacylglyceryltransferase